MDLQQFYVSHLIKRWIELNIFPRIQHRRFSGFENVYPEVRLFKKESVIVQGISGSRDQSLPFPEIPEMSST
jgi:hypothetical protein